MIYTFSPNWYRPQCIYPTQEFIYYASNYLFYRFNLQLKSVDKELSLRQIAIQNSLNYKDVKINCIQLSEQNLLIGSNLPVIILVSKDTLTLQKIIKLNNIASVDHLYNGFQNSIMLVDGQALLYRMDNKSYQVQLIQLKISAYTTKKDKVKLIARVKQWLIVIYMKGTIIIFDDKGKLVLKIIESMLGQVILSADVSQQTIYLLSKQKQQYVLTIFDVNLLQGVGFNNQLQQISTNLKRMIIKLYYTKKYQQRIKHNKASLIIKNVGDKIIFSGKLGQVYQIYYHKINNNQQIIIRAFSLEQNKFIIMWADSKHYKEIYGIYSTNKYILMIGIDHIMSIWSKNNQLKHKFSIKFMTSAAQNIFFSHADPQMVFLLLKDSIVRSFSPLEIGAHYLHQHWKFAHKLIIKRAACHISQVGILGLTTQCKKVLIYDIYEDRLIKTFQVETSQINSISFQNINIIEELVKMYDNKPKSIKLVSLCHYIKQLDCKVCLLLQVPGFFYIFSKLSEKQPQMLSIVRYSKIERIHHNCYWDNKLLLSSQVKQNNLILKLIYKHQHYHTILQHKHGKRHTFKAPKNKPELYVISYKGQQVIINQCRIGNQNLQIFYRKQVHLQYPINFISLSYQTNQIGLYNINQDIIQIYNLQQQITCYCMVDTKIECFSFYQNNYIIVCSKDQAVKIINYRQSLLMKDQIKLKKNQKQNKNINKLLQKKNNHSSYHQNIKKEQKQIIKEQQQNLKLNNQEIIQEK